MTSKTNASRAASRKRVGRVAMCVLAVGLVLIPVAGPRRAAAGGVNLTGRKAPDMVFTGGLHGIHAGLRLSSFRGKVVVLVFWTHTCPICLRRMHAIETQHERWQHFGLQVVTVVNKVQAGPVAAVMSKHRWTFPVALDITGSLAAPYRVRHRPVEYVLDPTGRVVSSNRSAETAIAKALGTMRWAQIQPVPESGAAVAALVRAGTLGSALKQAESATDAAFAARVGVVATAQIQALAARARERLAAGRRSEAGADLRTLQTAFAGTSREALALQLYAQIRPQ